MADFMQRLLLAIVIAVVVVFIVTRMKFPSDHPGFAEHEMSTHLSPDLIDGVKRFVFFVGYARSGHSIIGSLMDAHPHVIIANEFFLFSNFAELDKVPDQEWKSNLFDTLYKKSVEDLHGRITDSNKGYSLEVKGLWQGTFDKYIEVIGDKSGGITTKEYIRNSVAFKKNYTKLQSKLSIPLRIILAVRNPFDIISTKVNYVATNITEYQKLKLAIQSSSSVQKLKVSEEVMLHQIGNVFREADAVTEMIEEVIGRENVLEVHNCDMVSNPRRTLSRIFQFIEVDTSEKFLDTCAAKIYKSVFRSRDTIDWDPELRKMVEMKMKKYEMFNRYSFTSDW